MMVKTGAHGAMFLLGAAIAFYVVGPPRVRAEVQPLELTMRPVPLVRSDPAVGYAGPLQYLGGIVLKSPDRAFGGLSDLRFDAACGRLLAVTDTGAWVAFDPVERDGRLVGVGQAWIAPLLDGQGAAAPSKGAADAEALVMGADGVQVWFEGDNRVQRYVGLSACDPQSLTKAAAATVRPPDMRGWPSNGGAEAAAAFGAGQIVVSESMVGPTGGRMGYVVDAGGAVQAELELMVPEGFSPTALALLDEDAKAGRYLLLMRRLSPVGGLSARLSVIRVPVDGGRVEVPILAELAPPYVSDNFEGVAVRREGDATSIYLLSDDNFNFLQRTLLLKFRLP